MPLAADSGSVTSSIVPPQGRPKRCASSALMPYFIASGRGLDAFAMHAVDDVVLDAAAGNRADHEAVVTHRQHRAFGAGRRAPGSDDRHQQYAMPFLLPAHAAFRTSRSTLSMIVSAFSCVIAAVGRFPRVG
jgi:hypothetical protein